MFECILHTHGFVVPGCLMCCQVFLLDDVYQCEEACKTGLWIFRAQPAKQPCLVEPVPPPPIQEGKDRKLWPGQGEKDLHWGEESGVPSLTLWNGDIPHIEDYKQDGQYYTVLSPPLQRWLVLTIPALSNSSSGEIF